jgi:hypothetical protein
MDRVKKVTKKLLLSYRSMPQKKQYLEFITALLSIPVLITVIIINLNSLNKIKNPSSTDSNKQVEKIIYTAPSDTAKINNVLPSQTLVTKGACKEEVGPVEITSPQENDSITNNPITIDISYPDNSYCAVAWSYRINNGSWSDYDDKSLAIYNPPNGKIRLDLKIKSIVNGKEKSLTRSFMYEGTSSVISPTPDTGNQSSSAAAH